MRQMKDSGIEWIGEIPQDWNMIRLRFLCEIKTGNQDTQDRNPDGKYPFYVRSPIVEKCDNYSFDGSAILMAGDGVGAGKVFHIVDGKYGCHQRVYSLQNIKDIDRKYLYYILQNRFYVSIDTANSKSTVDSVRQNMLLDFPVVHGTWDVQRKIVCCLDNKCTEIDNAIAKTTASIEEYKKLKQAIITKAVTKGICGNRPMKDSGIEWIGEIPSDWEICKVRHIGTLQNGISKGGEFFGSGFPFVSYGDVYRNISLPACVDGLVQSSSEEQKLYSVQEGDIFFTRTSETIEEVGFSSVCENDIPKATFAGFLIRLRPNKNKIYSGFSKYYFRSSHHRSFLVKEMNLVTRASLGQSLLKSMFVLLPGMNEQYEIAEYLDSKCNEIDNITSRKQQLITELEAYKKSLIYEYVTGKKEVV